MFISTRLPLLAALSTHSSPQGNLRGFWVFSSHSAAFSHSSWEGRRFLAHLAYASASE